MAYRPDSEFKKPISGFFSSDTFVKSYTFYVKPRFPIENEVKLVVWVIDDLGSLGARQNIRTDDELATVSGYKPNDGTGIGKTYPRDGNKALIAAFFNLPNTNPKNGAQLSAQTYDNFYLNLDPSKSNMNFQLPGYYSAQAMFDRGEWSGGDIKPTSTDTYIDLAINGAKLSYKKVIYQLPLTGESDLPNFSLPENKVEFEQRAETPPAPTTGPTVDQLVASQVVTPSPPPDSNPTPSAGKLYKAFVFNVEKQNILVPIANNFDLGELTIVKREFTPPPAPQVPASDRPTNTDIGEFSNMAPVDIPPKAPPRLSSPTKHIISPTSYSVANKKDKAQIMLHYSAGWQITDKCKQVVDVLMKRSHNENKRYQRDPINPKKYLKDGKGNPIQDPNWIGDMKGYSYHYIIAVDGHIENLVDPKDTALHGGDVANFYSIGISLQCLGVEHHSNAANGIELADKKVDAYRLNSRHPSYSLNESHVELVDFDEKKRPYRGMRFSQEVSIEQLRSLSSLLKKLRQEFPNIPAWDGLTQEKFDILFPSKATTGKSITYEKDKPGLYSHCSWVSEKFDMLPTPRMIKFLKQLRF